MLKLFELFLKHKRILTWGFAFSVLAIIADLTGVLGFFGISMQSSQPVIKITVIFPTQSTITTTPTTKPTSTSKPQLTQTSETPYTQTMWGSSAYVVGHGPLVYFSHDVLPDELSYILWPDHCIISNAGIRLDIQKSVKLWWKIDLGDFIPQKINSITYTQTPWIFTTPASIVQMVYRPSVIPLIGIGDFEARGGKVEQGKPTTIEVWGNTPYDSTGLKSISIIIPIEYTYPSSSYPIFYVYAQNQFGVPYRIGFSGKSSHPAAPKVACRSGSCYIATYDANIVSMVDFNPSKILTQDRSVFDFCR
jgi:hypothetical protein